MWVTGWLAGWFQQRVLAVGLSPALTHVCHFMVVPNADGTLQITNRPGFESAAAIASVVDATHAINAKAIVTIGGAGSYTEFSAALQAPVARAALATNLVAFAQANNYDGIDVDMEPINEIDFAGFAAFVLALRAAWPTAVITVAGASPDACLLIHDVVDQINVMTYDMSGAWDGWVSWHNSPITASGEHFPPPVDWRELPSCDLYLREYAVLGIPRSKLALGLDLYGYRWPGVAAPRLDVSAIRPQDVSANIPYYNLARDYDLAAAQWDERAGAAWLGTAANEFISFDNERTAAAKVQYVRDHALGGIAVWEIAGGVTYAGTQPVTDALVQAVAVPRARYFTVGGAPFWLVYDEGTGAFTGVSFHNTSGRPVWVRLTHRASGSQWERTFAAGERVAFASAGITGRMGTLTRRTDSEDATRAPVRVDDISVEMRS